ncbi:PREDICTED: uncharacterized protein LOC105456509 [Wasmannia auropunctata]|uniref:uncharacterized protein LOC105456509 n=1 Tax=Wasmannia auropunctata TaxID=64793 RepID=UPI0005EF5A09|nr:PREDICTED: uncharacterized protein LOC105456509 [Wasmannia auropunctata]
MIHLRWQSPRPPLNGKLRDYTVQLCESLCTNITVQLNESCNLWNDSICTIVKKSPTLSQRIKVFASNINVTEPGPPVFITDDMLNNTTPDPPANSTSTINENSVVDLEWLHPWKTGAQLKSFRIQIEQIYSNLFQSLLPKFINKTLEYPVTQYMPNYSQRLYLLPATHYSIHVQAVTIANTFSNIKSVDVHTPSTAAFDGDLEVMIDKSDYTILLKIPPVKNDTQLSKMHIIIVNRNKPCDQYLEVPQNLRTLARVRTYETAWQAAEVLTSEYAGKQEFRVGDNEIYGGARNCPLKSGELYEIVIIVIEQNSDSSTKPIMLTKSVRIDRDPSHYLAWLIPIILFFVVSCATFYFCRRNRHQKEIKRKIRTEHESMKETKFNEEEMKSLNLEDNLSTLSDGHTLSLVTTPEVSSMIVVHDDEKEENENKLPKRNYTHVQCNPKQYRSYSLPLEFSDSSKSLQKTSCFRSNEF